MTPAVAIRNDDEAAMRERKCIVTGEVREEAHLIRFAVSPDGDVVPDIAAKLPGRGIWVGADRATLERAIAKNLFSKAAKANVAADADLADRVEHLIAQRMIGDLGMARRSGAIVTGFDQVARALESAVPPAVLMEASDGAADGRRKIFGMPPMRAGFRLQFWTAFPARN